MAALGQTRSMARVSVLHNAFTTADRRRLAQALSTALPARVYRRVAAVVEVADGQDVRDIARRLGVSRATIYHWVARYLASRQPASLDSVRPDRLRCSGVSDRRLTRVLARDPRALGYQSATWTGRAARRSLRRAPRVPAASTHAASSAVHARLPLDATALLLCPSRGPPRAARGG